MLKRLRARIICMLMTVVLLIMAAVVTGIYLVTQEQLAVRQLNALQHLSQLPLTSDTQSIPEAEKEASHTQRADIPFFTVRLNENGKMLAFFSRRYAVDEKTALTLAHQAVGRERNSGVLRSSSLRYLMQKDGRGNVRITFVSMLESEEQLEQLLRTALIICLIIAIGSLFTVMFPLARWLTQPVEEAWNKQKRFIADASHELKTPLTVILANLSIVRKQCTAAELRPWLDSSTEEADRMKILIDEMLCLARNEDARSAFCPVDAPVSDMIERLVMAMEPVAYESGADLSYDIEDDLHLRCDVEKLRHALQTLLENAIKYAGRSKRIHLSAKRERRTILIMVKNDGEPIPASDLPHLFERFYRADASRSGHGYGLGLSIAKQMIELHRGRIEVRSCEEEGTTFIVRLPSENS